jgi:hypothetical protein
VTPGEIAIRMIARRVFGGIGIAAAGWPSLLAAQAVRGSVVDSVRGSAMDSVFVELLASDERLLAFVRSNNGGRFYIQAPEAGSYRVRLRQVGYASFTSPLLTLARSRDATLNVRLVPLAVELEPLVVVRPEEDRFLRTVGFYDRRQSGTGAYLDPAYLAKVAPKARQTVDVLDGVPGVTLVVGGGSWGVRMPRLTRQMDCDKIGPRIFLDGNNMTPGDTGFDLADVNPLDLLAIEIYDSVSEVPLQYGGDTSVCGVLVIWTKR